MEKFQGLCDQSTGHDPFRPLTTPSNVYDGGLVAKTKYTCWGVLCIMSSLVSFIVKLLVVPICLPFGRSPKDTIYRVSRTMLWVPMAWAMGIDPHIYSSVLSDDSLPTDGRCLEDVNLSFTQHSIILSVLTSVSDILFWCKVIKVRPVFVFGVLDGGYLVTDSIHAALDMASRIEPLRLHIEQKAENVRLPEGRFFTSFSTMTHFILKEAIGPAVVFPQTQRSNGSGLLPWTSDITKSYTAKYNTKVMKDLEGPSDGTFKLELYVSVPILNDGSENCRSVAFPNTIRDQKEYICHQLSLGRGDYNMAICEPTELIKSMAMDSLDQLEDSVSTVQSAMYSTVFHLIGNQSSLVSKSSKIYRCKEVNLDAQYQYMKQYRHESNKQD